MVKSIPPLAQVTLAEQWLLQCNRTATAQWRCQCCYSAVAQWPSIVHTGAGLSAAGRGAHSESPPSAGRVCVESGNIRNQS